MLFSSLPLAKKGVVMGKTAEDRKQRKQRVGVVISDRMNKTIVVKIERIAKHPLYKRTVRIRSKFKVHDEQNQAKIGDRVRIIETRPLSKEKRWRLVEIIKQRTENREQKAEDRN